MSSCNCTWICPTQHIFAMIQYTQADLANPYHHKRHKGKTSSDSHGEAGPATKTSVWPVCPVTLQQASWALLSCQPHTQIYTCMQDERMSPLELMTTDDLQLPLLQKPRRSLPGQPVNWLTVLSCNYELQGA